MRRPNDNRSGGIRFCRRPDARFSLAVPPAADKKNRDAEASRCKVFSQYY